MSAKIQRLRTRARPARGGSLRAVAWGDAWSLHWLRAGGGAAWDYAAAHPGAFVLAEDATDAPGRRYHLVLRRDFDALLDEPGYRDEVVAAVRRCVEAWRRELDRPEIVVCRRDLSRLAELVIVDPSAG